MNFADRFDKYGVILVSAIALFARLLFFLADLSNPFHLYPVIDENEFYQSAKEIAEKGIFSAGYFWHPPLYTFFLALLLKLGFSIQGIVLVQMLAGVAGVVLLYLALRNYYPLVALMVSIIFAIYPLQLFTESRLLSENLFIFLSVLFIFISSFKVKKSWHYYLLSLLAGLMIITRSQFLIFLIIWIFILFFYEKFPLKKLVPVLSLSLFFPLMVIFHNAWHTGGKLWFISANGPVNLYIGNSENIEQTLNIRPIEWKERFFPELYDMAGIYFSPEDTQKRSYPYLLSEFLIKKTIKENTDLQVFVNNLLQKTLVVLHAHETPRNYDIYQWRKFNEYLRFSVTEKPFRLPLALFYFAALIFIFSSWKRLIKDDFHRLLICFIISGLLPSVLFFNAFRYRLVIVPFLLVFAVLFYLKEIKNLKLQLINLIMIVLLGSGISNSLLIQKIPESETWRLAGDGWLNKKEYEKAENCYLKSLKNLEHEPDNELAHTAIIKKLASLAMMTGQQDKAAKILERETPKSTGSADLIFARATALYMKGDYNQAIKDYTLSLTFNDLKINPQAYHGRALCYIRLNKISDAFHDFDSAILLKPDYAEAWSNRGILKGRQGDTQGALKDLSTAIQLNPLYAKAYLNRGIAYLTINDINKAINDFNKVISIDSLNAQAYYLRGMVYIDEGRKDKGCIDLHKSLQLGFKQAESDLKSNCR